MTKLIKSDLRLTLRHPVFIFGMLLTLAVNLWFHLKDNSGGSIEYIFRPFSAFFLLAPGMCVLTVFTCGTDLSSRTVNRKLSVGYTKKEIYFSHLITSLVAVFFLTLPCFVSIIAPVYLAKLNFGVIAVYYIYSLFALFAMTAVIVFITMLLNMRAAAFVISFILCICGIFITINLSERIEEPEYFTYHTTIETPIIDENGNVLILQQFTDEQVKEKNPNYISGKKRIIYEAISRYYPGCFLFNVSQRDLYFAESGFDDVRFAFDDLFKNKVKEDLLTVPFSICVLAFFSLFGAEMFRRKDLL